MLAVWNRTFALTISIFLSNEDTSEAHRLRTDCGETLDEQTSVGSETDLLRLVIYFGEWRYLSQREQARGMRVSSLTHSGQG